MAMALRTLEWHAANGDVIRFSGSPPFLLDTFYPGVSSGAAEAVRGIRMDGQNTYHVSKEPLTPSASGSIQAAGGTYVEKQKNLDDLRRRLQAALDPKHFGVLLYNNFSGSFRLPCRPIAGAAFDKRLGSAIKFDAEWISDAPHWTQAAQVKLSVGLIKKMWRFPWAVKPTVFGSITNRGYIINPTSRAPRGRVD